MSLKNEHSLMYSTSCHSKHICRYPQQQTFFKLLYNDRLCPSNIKKHYQNANKVYSPYESSLHIPCVLKLVWGIYWDLIIILNQIYCCFNWISYTPQDGALEFNLERQKEKCTELKLNKKKKKLKKSYTHITKPIIN